MLITDSFVFLEIVPATGGDLIRPILRDHLPIDVYDGGKNAPYDELPRGRGDLPGFYVVRSPWSWYVSWAHRLAHAATRRGRPDPENMNPEKRVIWEDVFRLGHAKFKEIVTRLCVGDFDHPVVPIMQEEGIDFYSARVRYIVGEALERPDFTPLKFEQLRSALPPFLGDHAPVTPELRKAIQRTPMAPEPLAPQLDYDEALVELVREKTAWFCERFGYPRAPVGASRKKDAQPRRASEPATAGPTAPPGAEDALSEDDEYSRAVFSEQARRHAAYLGVRTHEGSYLVSTSDQKVGRSLFVKQGRPEFRVLQRAVSAIEGLMGEDAITDRQFIDVGANIGTETIAALTSHRFGSAVCCEPDEANNRLLRANLALNDLEQRVQPLCVAASNRVGRSKLVVASTSGGNSWVAVDDSGIREKEAAVARVAAEDPTVELSERTVVDVELVTLNGLAQSGVIDAEQAGMLWIDAEGHEGHVLEGADALADRGVPTVVEFAPANLNDRGDRPKLHEVAEQFYTHFVDLRRAEPMRPNRSLRPVTELHALADALSDLTSPGSFTDVLLVRLEADQATVGAELPERMKRGKVHSHASDSRDG